MLAYPYMIRKLAALCTFFEKRAELREDMAKRIFLSVIPAVMGKTENYYTQGTDYKLLKSASNGANDLIKYGATSCINELKHYGATGDKRFQQQYITKHKPKDATGKPMEWPNVWKIATIYKNKAESILQNPQNDRYSVLGNSYYSLALKVCVDSFSDAKAWEPSYGGKPWAKIATTLYDLNHNVKLLLFNRSNARDRRERDKDYLQEEIELMRHQIVLMNLFDGLAHNTANVMGNLVEEERFDRSKLIKSRTEEGSETRYKLLDDLANFQAQNESAIERMMDAKELANPLLVYKVLQPEIKRMPQRKMMEDWINKIESKPEYHTMGNDSARQLMTVRIKKELIVPMKEHGHIIEELTRAKDSLLKPNPEISFAAVSSELYWAMSYFDEGLCKRMEYIYGKDEYKGLYEQLAHIRAYCDQIQDIANRYRNRTGFGAGTVNTVDATNDYHGMKQRFTMMMTKIEELV